MHALSTHAPDTICAAMRAGSPALEASSGKPTLNPYWDSSENTHAPSATRMCVRRPAVRFITRRLNHWLFNHTVVPSFWAALSPRLHRRCRCRRYSRSRPRMPPAAHANAIEMKASPIDRENTSVCVMFSHDTSNSPQLMVGNVAGSDR